MKRKPTERLKNGRFKSHDDRAYSSRIYGCRIPVEWEIVLRGLPVQSEYIREALRLKMIADGIFPGLRT